MDCYVRMYEEYGKVEGDNPTIGLILCSEKNEAIARYSVLKGRGVKDAAVAFCRRSLLIQ